MGQALHTSWDGHWCRLAAPTEQGKYGLTAIRNRQCSCVFEAVPEAYTIMSRMWHVTACQHVMVGSCLIDL